jgi:hypothetical protein
MRSVVRGTYPVEQVVHGVVLQPVAHQPADPGRADPALMAQHPKCLRDSIFRAPEGGGEVTDADTGRAMQTKQYLKAVRIGQQVETLSPAPDVHIGQRGRGTLDLRLVLWTVHKEKSNPRRR